MLARERFERGAHGLVCGDPAGDHQRGHGAGFAQCARQPVDQAVDRGLLETGGDIGRAVRAALHRAQHCAFQARKAEMRLGRSLQRAGQRHRAGIALERQPLDRRAAGIAEAQDLGGLVEGFAQRIVDRGGKAAVLPDAFDGEDLAMPARYQQQEIGKSEIAVGQPGGKRVAFEVVDREQRLVRSHRQCLGADQPDHHPADQPGTRGRGNRVDIVEAHLRFAHYLGDHRRQAFRMRARGDFGNDPAIGRVFGFLAGDRLRDNRPVPAHQRDSRLIAAGFDAQNERHV